MDQLSPDVPPGRRHNNNRGAMVGELAAAPLGSGGLLHWHYYLTSVRAHYRTICWVTMRAVGTQALT